MNIRHVAVPLMLIALPFQALALDGKWTPQQVLDIAPAWLAEQGLALSPAELWDSGRGTGLLTAAVNIGGCSGGFVSATGLIVTNHHCLFGLLQEHSSPDRDLISDGFLARTRDDELPGSTLRVQVPKRFTDVTARVLGAVPDSATPLARLDAIDNAQRQLVEECEQQADTHCRVAVYDDGVNYTLIESIELTDVRLVYAPPRAIGEFGGEVDNWSWPRHTGDVAIARAWAGPDNQPAQRSDESRPYSPEFFFSIAQRPLAVDDFVMVLGYPGITYRSLLAEEMQERRDRFFVRRADLFGEWIEQLEAASEVSDAGRIAVAANLKGIRNRHKNALGQIAGLDRGRIIEKQARQDEAVARHAQAHPEHRDALGARDALREVLAEREQTWERDFLLNLIPLGIESVPGGIPPLPKGLYFGTTLAHWAREQQKPDTERARDFRADDLPRLRERLRREQSNYLEQADKRILRALVGRALALPPGQRIVAIDQRFEGLDDGEVDSLIDRMYSTTELLDAGRRETLLDLSIEELQQAAKDDPLLSFALDWNRDLRTLREREREWDSRSAAARPAWRRAVAAEADTPIAPDANGTLRVSFGHVQGYDPRDGVRYTPFTSLSGVVEKHTGEEPFDAPPSLRAATAIDTSRWRSPHLGDIPVNFLADGDTSGGNSGSPVLNGRGELVGVNFDRVWENVANDFGFNPAVARNISVDIRYLLWLLDSVEQADELLRELGIERGVRDWMPAGGQALVGRGLWFGISGNSFVPR